MNEYRLMTGTDFDETGASVDVVITPTGQWVAVNEHGWYSAQRESVSVEVGMAAATYWERTTGKQITAPGWRSW